MNASRNKSVKKEVVRILRLRINTADKKIKDLENEWKTVNLLRIVMSRQTS